jgi:multiple sugar transport system substrate-binding protein
LIVVDDPALAEAIQQQWKARAEGELEVRKLESAELGDPRRKRLAADAVIYPSGLIGELAERGWIVPLSDDSIGSPEFARRDIFDLLRQHEIMWGDQVYAVPLGSPALTLIYRPDMFEKLGVKPPESWQQYGERCAQLARSRDLLVGSENGPGDWHAVAEPLGPGWASQVLLARAAAYARHRSYFATLFDLQSMEPLIASPPFVKALEELVAAAKFGAPDSTKLTPADVWKSLGSGRCAMGLTWPSAAEGGTENSPRPGLLAAAELPASAQAYHVGDSQWQTREPTETGRVTLLSVAGRLGSVVKGSARSPAAASLLVRLSSAEWSKDVSPRSPATTLYRSSQIPQAKTWTGESLSAEAATAYGELVQQVLGRTLSLDSVRLPGRARYLTALDEAVHAAIRGDRLPAECLTEAANQWCKITQDLGIENQRRAYWRSLGKTPP